MDLTKVPIPPAIARISRRMTLTSSQKDVISYVYEESALAPAHHTSHVAVDYSSKSGPFATMTSGYESFYLFYEPSPPLLAQIMPLFCLFHAPAAMQAINLYSQCNGSLRDRLGWIGQLRDGRNAPDVYG